MHTILLGTYTRGTSSSDQHPGHLGVTLLFASTCKRQRRKTNFLDGGGEVVSRVRRGFLSLCVVLQMLT